MDLKIKASPKGFETVNCILGQALSELEAGYSSLMWIGLTKADIEHGRRFSRALKRAFLDAHKQTTLKGGTE